MDKKMKLKEIMVLLRDMNYRMLCDVYTFILAYSSAKKTA